jgi:CheY-like chemotaxis protein
MRADERLEAIPKVAVSACSLPSDHADAIDAGFRDYVVKPVQPTALRDLVTNLLR